MALWLRYAEDMPVKEIARVKGKTKTHVKVLLHRARSALGRKLQASESLAVRRSAEQQTSGLPTTVKGGG